MVAAEEAHPKKNGATGTPFVLEGEEGHEITPRGLKDKPQGAPLNEGGGI